MWTRRGALGHIGEGRMPLDADSLIALPACGILRQSSIMPADRAGHWWHNCGR